MYFPKKKKKTPPRVWLRLLHIRRNNPRVLELSCQHDIITKVSLWESFFFSHCVVYLKEKMCHIKICSEVFFLVEDERMRRQETLMRANIQTGFTFKGRITISENSTFSQRFQTADFFKYNTVLPPSGHFDLNLFTLFFITQIHLCKKEKEKNTKPFSQLTINQ